MLKDQLRKLRGIQLLCNPGSPEFHVTSHLADTLMETGGQDQLQRYIAALMLIDSGPIYELLLGVAKEIFPQDHDNLVNRSEGFRKDKEDAKSTEADGIDRGPDPRDGVCGC